MKTALGSMLGRDNARSMTGALLGVGLGELTARMAAGRPAEQQVVRYSAGLAIAAAIYPAARRRWRLDRSSAGELIGLAGYGVASATAVLHPRARANRLLAAGWASHALFDAAHGHDEGSRLPRGYPAFCAAYDLVLAAHLLRAA